MLRPCVTNSHLFIMFSEELLSDRAIKLKWRSLPPGSFLAGDYRQEKVTSMHNDVQGCTRGELEILWETAEIKKVPGDLDKWACIGGQEEDIYI